MDMIHGTQFRTQNCYKDCIKLLQLALFKRFLDNIKRLISMAQLAPAGRCHNHTTANQHIRMILMDHGDT